MSRSTAHYPGLVKAPSRKFVVYQKGRNPLTVAADRARLSDHGTLTFETNGEIHMAFSPQGWTFMEEEDVDD